MSYLSVRNTKKNQTKKNGVAYFVSEITRVDNCPDFEILVHEIKHGLQEFTVTSKVSQRKRTILVIFCRSTSVV